MVKVQRRFSVGALAGLVIAGCFGALPSRSMAQSTVVANFEDGTTDGVGYLTGSTGVQQYSGSGSPSASIITPASGGDTTQVFDLTAPGFNGGGSSATDIGYDFVANGFGSTFLADDVLTFNWEVAPSATTGGYSQLYNIVLNAPGPGYTGVGGSSGTTGDDAVTIGTVNQYPGYTGQVNSVSINYDVFKGLITANPGYIQLGIQTNNGGGAPPDVYFDDFTLSVLPEPASAGSIAMICAMALLARRKRASLPLMPSSTTFA